MSSGTVFPVGHYCGTGRSYSPPTRAGADAEDHLVRVGNELEHLTDDEFGIWVLAHGLAEVGRDDWTTRDIRQRATDARLVDPAGGVDRLVDRGLLVTAPTRPERIDGSVAFASTYKLAPLLVGLGTVPGRPDQHAIGIPGVGTAALLDAGCYELWRQSAVAGNLWQLCQDRVARAAAGSGPDDLIDPTGMLGVLLGELRVLIVHGCAYLDIAAGRTEPGCPDDRDVPGTGSRPDPTAETDETGAPPRRNVPE